MTESQNKVGLQRAMMVIIKKLILYIYIVIQKWSDGEKILWYDKRTIPFQFYISFCDINTKKTLCVGACDLTYLVR